MSAVKIGDISLGEKPCCLAPMAGTSSVTYRGICHEMGSSYAPTELCSARSVVYNGIEKSFRFLEIDKEREGLSCIQLFGNDPEDFVFAINAIEADERLKGVDIIDINMGCPVSKVIKTGAGSALMREPQLASDIVKASVETASKYNVPVTVKTRIGYSEFSDSSLRFVEGLADAGAAMICVHGRTQSQLYHGQADIDALKKMSEVVRAKGIPFFANGDICDVKSAVNMFEVTSCDGIMVGRAAQGNPWIFKGIRDALDGKNAENYIPDADERISVLLRELKGTASRIGEKTAVKEMRSVMPNYIKGLHGAASIKTRLCTANTIEDVETILDECRIIWSEN